MDIYTIAITVIGVVLLGLVVLGAALSYLMVRVVVPGLARTMMEVARLREHTGLAKHGHGSDGPDSPMES